MSHLIRAHCRAWLRGLLLIMLAASSLLGIVAPQMADLATAEEGTPGAPVAFFNPTSATAQNVALLEAGATWPAVSSYYDSNHTPSWMLNFDPVEWNPWATTSNTNQWVKIALAGDRTYLIDRVQIMGRRDYSTQRVRDFKIAVSTTTLDDAAFTTVLTATVPNTSNLVEFALPNPVLARYVRYSPLNNWGSCCNISTQQFKVMSGQSAGPAVTFQDLSTDPDGDIVSWSWDFGDGTTSTDRSPSHVFPGTGTYNVALTVVDAAGHSSTFSLPQHVVAAPTASFSVNPVTPNEGQNVTFTDTSTAPAGASIARRAWYWDNGTVHSNSSVVRSYPDNGSYDATIEVLTNANVTARLEQTITVLNVTPNATAGSDRSQQWGDYLYAGSANDPGTTDNSQLQVQLNWGDGSPVQRVGSGYNWSHFYALPGTYDFSISAQDKDLASASDNAVFTITRRNTSLSYTGQSVLRVGENLRLSARLNNLRSGQFSGRTVKFSVGSQLFTPTTDGSGDVYLNNNFAAGTYPISLQFDGDTYYNPSSGSASLTVYDDWTAPTTTISLAGSQIPDDWFSTDVTVTLDRNDNVGGSGIAKTEYSFDGGRSWRLYTGPFVVNRAGSNTLWVRSTDLARNVEAPVKTFVKVDKTPLIERIEAGQAGLDWITIGVKNWTSVSGTCEGCHVQGVSLYGMAVSTSTGYSVDRSDSTGAGYVANFIASTQNASGTIGRYVGGGTCCNEDNTLSAFGGMGLAAYDRYISTSKSQNLVKLANWTLGRQQANGRWIQDGWFEPPVMQGDAMTTGSFIDVLVQAKQRVDTTTAGAYQSAIDRAVAWIRGQTLPTTQDKTYAMIGLKAAGLSNDDTKVAALRSELLASQIGDYSWKEQAALPGGSAYATGQALYALCLAGVTLDNPSVQRGVNWLIHSQQSHSSDRLVPQNFANGPWVEGDRYVNTDSSRPSKFLSTIWPVVALGCYGQLGLQVDVSPDRQIIASSSTDSQTVRYTVYVTNTGQISDTFSLAVSGGMPGWSATLDRTAIELGAQQSGTVTLTVVAPPNQPPSLPVYYTVSATSQSAAGVSAVTSVTTYTDPPPPVSGHATQTSITAGDGVSAVVSDTIRLAARVKDTVTGQFIAGPGKGTVTFFVAGAAVGSDSDANGDTTFEINWRPGWQWTQLGTQDLRAVYSGIDLPTPNPDLMPSFAAGNISISRPTNNPPVANAGGPYGIRLGQPVLLDGSASRDPDTAYGDVLSFSWDLNNDGNFGDASGAAPSVPWTTLQSLGLAYPANPATGLPANAITLRVSDFYGLSATASTTLSITVANTAPTLAPISDKVVNEETTLTFTATATDPDVPANRLTFTLNPGFPNGAIIDPATGLFSWTPTEAQGPGDYSVTVRVNDDGTPELSDSKTVRITVNEANKAPQLTPIGDKSVAWGNQLSFIATATDFDVPANQLTFSLVQPPTGANIDPSTGAFAWTPLPSQIGSHSFQVVVADNGSPVAKAAETITVSVGKRPTAITNAATPLVQYSDPATIGARLLDQGGGALQGQPLSAKPIAFAIGSQTASASTGTDGTASLTLVINQAAAAGVRLTANFSGDNLYLASVDDDAFTINKEATSLEYTGDSLKTTSSSANNSTASLRLAAAIREQADGNLGNKLATGQIKFSVFKFQDTGMTAPVAACTAQVTVGAAGTGAANCSVDLTADNYAVKVELLPNDYYLAPVESQAVTVVMPGTGFVTGGGWLNEPSLGSKSNFGFTVKYLKNGNVQGNSLYIYRVRADIGYGVRDYNYIIKSNAMAGLAQECSNTTPKVCTATFTGKNNITAVDRETGVATSLGGNYQFQVDVTDRAEPGSTPGAGPDSYAIRVWNATGNYYSLGAYTGTLNQTELPIDGGNIQVHLTR